MSCLEKSIEIASQAHRTQVTSDGNPYILHPLRMMLTLQHPDDRIVAVLHDVIEKADTWSIERLRLEGFSDSILNAIDALTRRKDEEYFELIQRACENSIARTVKIADLVDHIENFPAGKHSEHYAEGLRKLRQAS